MFSFKIKKVILRGPKDICLSRRCVRLKWHVPPYLWRLLRPEAASAFFAALAASAFGCFGLLRLHSAYGREMAAIVRDLEIGFPMVGCQAGSISAWLPNLS